MVNRKLFNYSIIAATAATSIFMSLVPANAASSCRGKADCACQIALESGSRSALRQFLRLYPKSDTACNAMALTTPIILDVGQGNGAPTVPSRDPHNSPSPQPRVE